MSFKDIDVLQEDSYKVGKQTSEHCLIFLRTWYEALYLQEDVAAYIDIELDMSLGKHSIYSTIPIIKSDGDSVQILQITDIPRENKQLFNSVEARGMAMLLSRYLVEDHVSVVSMAIGSRGGFKVSEIRTKIEDHARIRQRLVVMTNAYQYSCDDPYPSVTDQCDSCPFKWRCRL